MTLSRKVSGQQETRLSVPESRTSARLPDSGFDSSAAVLAEGTPALRATVHVSNAGIQRDMHTLPSLFEETENFGPKVVDIIAERVNDSCSKKPLDTKLKDLQEK